MTKEIFCKDITDEKNKANSYAMQKSNEILQEISAFPNEVYYLTISALMKIFITELTIDELMNNKIDANDEIKTQAIIEQMRDLCATCVRRGINVAKEFQEERKKLGMDVAKFCMLGSSLHTLL